MVLAMSEEQLKAAETEATAEQEEEFGEEISEDDLEGVAGGSYHAGGNVVGMNYFPAQSCPS